MHRLNVYSRTDWLGRVVLLSILLKCFHSIFTSFIQVKAAFQQWNGKKRKYKNWNVKGLFFFFLNPKSVLQEPQLAESFLATIQFQ